MTRSRFPRWVYGPGIEPDPRFSLANERTLLAWLRTALGLIAGGTALEALDVPMEPTFRLVAALTLLGGGALLPVTAGVDWARTERAMRRGAALPGGAAGIVLAATVGVVGALVLLGLLSR
ncbi:YidH family protein [Isoptericola aurantiacus]|uniref:YidH family protein n=1 Tax=Isoptericola aurantiacus TaxID=3377839 RepID=UPI00383B3DA3